MNSIMSHKFFFLKRDMYLVYYRKNYSSSRGKWGASLDAEGIRHIT